MPFDPGELKEVEQAPSYVPKEPTVYSPNTDYLNNNIGGNKYDLQGSLESYAQKPSDFNTQQQVFSFDWDKDNANRYVNQKNYQTLGFNPEFGELNEERFAQSQSVWDTAKNAVEGFGIGTVKSFANQFISWKDTASVFQDPTLQSAFKQDELDELNKKQQEFQNNYPIYKTDSDQNSFFSWDNFVEKVQGVGPIVGSIAELAAEEAATQLIVGATMGGAVGLEVPETARAGTIIGRTLDTGKQLLYGDLVSKGARTGEKLSQDLQPISNLNKFWSGFGSTLSNALPVNNTAKFVGEAWSNGKAAGMARTALKGFGSFYADMRHLNLAVSMASSNAAGTYQDLQTKLSEEFVKNNGRDPNGLESQHIQDIALQSAKTDGALNALAILYTNRLAFGNILKPNKAIQDALVSQGEGVFNKIGITPDYLLKEGEDKFFVKTNPWLSFKANMYALPKEILGAGAGFGATMSVMEGIDKGVKSYYQAMYDNKHLSGWENIKDSIDKQFSKEGAQTFISSFLTGAIALGVGGHLINQARVDPDRIFNREGFKTREAEHTTNAQEVADIFNEAWKKPETPIKDNIHQLVLQATQDARKQGSIQLGNKTEFHDAQDDATRLFLINTAKNGVTDMYLKRIQDQVQNLKPEDLCAAYNIPYSTENYIELKSQLDGFTGRAKDLTDVYKELKRKYSNPFNPFRFKKDSDEYNQESTKFAYYSHALDYLVWLKDITHRDIERQNNILYGDPKDATSTGLNSIKGFKDVGESFLYTLTNADFLQKEIEASKTELASLTGLTDKESQKQKVYTENKINLLDKWNQTLSEYSSKVNGALNNPDYDIQRTKLDELRNTYKPKFDEHLGDILDHELKHLDKPEMVVDDLASGTDRFMDYTHLSIMGDNALKSANTILHPEIISRFFDSFQKMGAEHVRQQEEELNNFKKAQEEAKNKTTQTTPETTKEPEVPADTVTSEDLQKQKAEEARTKKEKELAEGKKEFQLIRLTNVINETINKLQESKAKQSEKEVAITDTQKQLQESTNRLTDLQTKLQDKNIVKVDREVLEKAKSDMSLTVTTLDKTLEDLKDESLQLHGLQSILENHDKIFNQVIDEISKTGAIDVDSRLTEFRKQKADLEENTNIAQSLKDATSQKEMYDKEIKDLQKSVDSLHTDLDKVVGYQGVMGVIADVKNKADYVKNLTDLKDKIEDEEQKDIISDLLKLVRHFSGEQKLTKADLDSINAKHISNLSDVLENFTKAADALIKKESDAFDAKSKIEKLSDRAHQIQDIDNHIDRLNLLKEAFNRPENSFTKESGIIDSNSPLNQVNPDIGVVPEERLAPEKPNKAFRPGILFGTRGLHFIRQGSNDVLNRQEGTDRAYSYTSDVYFNPEESYWLQVITKDNDIYNLINKDFPDAIKLLRVDENGQPIDKDNKVTSDINQMLHWYAPEKHEGISLLQGDLLNPNAPEVLKIVAELKPRFSGTDLDKNLREEVVKYRQTIATIKNNIDKGNQQRVKITSKRQGAFSLEPFINNRVQKNPLQGRIIENKPDYKYLKDPNGQSLKFNFKSNGRVSLLRADGIELPIHNRDLFTHEKENVLNALKRLSLGGLSEDEKRMLGTYLRGTIFFGYPDVESGVVGANRIWIDWATKTIKKSIIDTKINPDTKKIENTQNYGFTESGIEAAKETLLKDIYHNVNKQLTLDINTPYQELNIINKGNHQYEINVAKTWNNYTHYEMAPNTERTHIDNQTEERERNSRDPILSTNIIKYEKDNIDRPRVKQSNLDFEYLGELVPLSEKLQVATELEKPKEVSRFKGYDKANASNETLKLNSEDVNAFFNLTDEEQTEEANAYIVTPLENNEFKIQELIGDTYRDIYIATKKTNGEYQVKEVYRQTPIKKVELKPSIEVKNVIVELKKEEVQPETVKPEEVNKDLTKDKHDLFSDLDNINIEGAEEKAPWCD